MYEIEKNKPIPELKSVHHCGEWPLAKMDVGDSFLAPFDSEDPKRKASLQTRIMQVARPERDKGKKFTTRSLPLENGIRVWRIE